jgi:hypothetical protein
VCSFNDIEHLTIQPEGVCLDCDMNPGLCDVHGDDDCGAAAAFVANMAAQGIQMEEPTK